MLEVMSRHREKSSKGRGAALVVGDRVGRARMERLVWEKVFVVDFFYRKIEVQICSVYLPKGACWDSSHHPDIS